MKRQRRATDIAPAFELHGGYVSIEPHAKVPVKHCARCSRDTGNGRRKYCRECSEQVYRELQAAAQRRRYARRKEGRVQHTN